MSLQNNKIERDCRWLIYAPEFGDEPIFDGESPEQIATRIVAAAAQRRPALLCISHVCWESGFVMPVLDVLDSLTARKRLPMPFVIIDGAQAAGQIEIPAELFTRVHFYATSGHKWLLGQETLGILYRNASTLLLPKLGKPLPLTESFAGYATPDEEESEQAATIAAAPRISLNAALCDITARTMKHVAEHNRALADRFRTNFEGYPGYHVVQTRSHSGIANVHADMDLRRCASILERSGFIVGINEEQGGVPMTLRICFHYYHGEMDVDELIQKLIDVRHRLGERV